jgi:hypothetical protein
MVILPIRFWRSVTVYNATLEDVYDRVVKALKAKGT